MKKLNMLATVILTVIIMCLVATPAMAAGNESTSVVTSDAYIWVGGEMRTIGYFNGEHKAENVFVECNTEIIRLFPVETRDMVFLQVYEPEQLKPWADQFGYTMTVDGSDVFLLKAGSTTERKSATVFRDGAIVNGVTVYYTDKTVYADKTSLGRIFPEMGNISFETVEAYTVNYWAQQYGYEMKLSDGRVDLTKAGNGNNKTEIQVYVNGTKIDYVTVYYEGNNTSKLITDVASLNRIFPENYNKFTGDDLTLNYWANKLGYQLAFNNNRVDLTFGTNNKTEVQVYVNGTKIDYVTVYYEGNNTSKLITDVASLNRIFPENYNKFTGNDLTLNYWANKLGYQLSMSGNRVDLAFGNGNGNGNTGNPQNIYVVVFVNGTQITNTNAYYSIVNQAAPNSTIVYADRVTLERIFSGYASQLTFNDGNDYTINGQAAKLGFSFSFNIDAKRVDLIRQNQPGNNTNPSNTYQYNLVVDGVTTSVHPTLTTVGTTTQLQVTAQEANHILDMAGVSMSYNQPTDVASLAVRCGYAITTYQNRVYFHTTGEKPLEVRVKGTPVDFTDQGPVVKDGRTLIPVRKVSELLGADVFWNGDDQSVTITKGTTTILIYLSRSDFYVNGVQMWFDVPPQVFNSRTVLPIRFVAEALGYTVGWDGDQPVGIVTCSYHVDP